MKFNIAILSFAAVFKSKAIELILDGEIEGDLAAEQLLEQEEGFLEELNFLRLHEMKDTFGDFEIVHSESPPIIETKKEEKVETKPKEIEMKKLDEPPTKFTDGSPYYAHKVPEKYSPGNEFLRDWERIPHDTLMNTLVSKYAWEGKDKETGRPNGRFFINRDGARKAF